MPREPRNLRSVNFTVEIYERSFGKRCLVVRDARNDDSFFFGLINLLWYFHHFQFFITRIFCIFLVIFCVWEAIYRARTSPVALWE